jgi:hypothetical protein
MKPTFATATRDATAMRLLKRASAIFVIAFVALGLFSGFRALVQVLGLELKVSDAILRPDTELSVEALTSGRVAVSVSLLFTQDGAATELDDILVIEDSDPSFDPRFKRGRVTLRIPPELLADFHPGPLVIRAIARGGPQWLRTPPPTVREVTVTVGPMSVPGTLRAMQAPAPTTHRADSTRRVVTQRAREILAALSARDIGTLSTFVHPTNGVRISHGTYVQPEHDLHFSAEDLRKAWTSGQPFVWGTADGTGDPIRMNFRAYVELWMKPDYTKAPKVGYNAPPLRAGNTPNNLADVYPGSIRIEHHFPGFDARYDGMDWQSLWLVFQPMGADWYLVGIARGSWTI